MKSYLNSSILWLAFFFVVFQAACAADPWPEPDTARSDGGVGPFDRSPDDTPAADGESDEGGEEPGDDSHSQDYDGDNGVDVEDEDEDVDGTSSQAPDSYDTAYDTSDGEWGNDTASDGIDVPTDTSAIGVLDTDDDQKYPSTDSVEDDMDAGADDTSVPPSTTDTDVATDTKSGFATDTQDLPDGGSEDAGVELPPLEQVYCSAPGPKGMVTVVGLAGSILMHGQVTAYVEGAAYPLSIGKDGGFAGRVPADALSIIDVVLTFEGSGAESVTTVSPVSAENGFVGNEIMGPINDVDGLSEENLVIVRGNGERLDDSHFVVGANVGSATGSIVPVSCADNECSFDLLMPGKSGDEIDLFVVSIGKHQGSSDVQTVLVP